MSINCQLNPDKPSRLILHVRTAATIYTHDIIHLRRTYSVWPFPLVRTLLSACMWGGGRQRGSNNPPPLSCYTGSCAFPYNLPSRINEAYTKLDDFFPIAFFFYRSPSALAQLSLPALSPPVFRIPSPLVFSRVPASL